MATARRRRIKPVFPPLGESRVVEIAVLRRTVGDTTTTLYLYEQTYGGRRAGFFLADAQGAAFARVDSGVLSGYGWVWRARTFTLDDILEHATRLVAAGMNSRVAAKEAVGTMFAAKLVGGRALSRELNRMLATLPDSTQSRQVREYLTNAPQQFASAADFSKQQDIVLQAVIAYLNQHTRTGSGFASDVTMLFDQTVGCAQAMFAAGGRSAEVCASQCAAEYLQLGPELEEPLRRAASAVVDVDLRQRLREYNPSTVFGDDDRAQQSKLVVEVVTALVLQMSS